MTKSGHDARRPPEATIPAGGSAPARQSRASDIEARAAARLIALAALARMGKEHQAGAMARLAAWNKGQVQVLERQAERQGKRLVRKAKGPLAASQ
jgi:hypothetical protein